MAKFTPSKADKKLFSNLKTRSKRKVNRIKKQHAKADLSDIHIPSKITDFKSRKEFNEWKEKQNFFLIRNNSHYQFKTNKYGLTESVRNLHTIKVATKIAQGKAREQIQDVETKSVFQGGEKIKSNVGQVMAQMGKPNAGGVVVPSDFDFEQFKTKRGLAERLESMNRRSKDDHYEKKKRRMKENFIEVLEKAYNSDGDELVQLIRDMDDDDFYRIYVRTTEFDFDLYYGKDGEIHEPNNAPLSRMLDYVKRFNKNQYDNDLEKY